MKECENFYASLSIRGLGEQKSRIHVSYSRHSHVCIDDKRIYMITEYLEQRSWHVVEGVQVAQAKGEPWSH